MPLILMQTNNSRYNDSIGELYHFPTRYRTTMLDHQGQEFIYYRGREDSPSGLQEYFGMAVIGEIYEDPDTITRRANKMWFCKIEDYIEFEPPVYYRKDMEDPNDKNYYLESGANPARRGSNYFRLGVRLVSESDFDQIIAQTEPTSHEQPRSGYIQDTFGEHQIQALENTPVGQRESKEKDRKGQRNFRKRLLSIYNESCSITGTNYDACLDAAHIHPYVAPESNNMQNGLLLRKDIHRLFDLNLISIDTQYTIHISSKLDGTGYEELQGKTMQKPEDELLRPSKAVLKWKFKEFKE